MAFSIPESFIETLLASCDIVTLIRNAVPTLDLKKTGKKYKSSCPFHQENTPSFIINADSQYYYCFGCKATGNAISFVMQYERLGFVEAVKRLADDLHIPLPDSAEKSPKQFQHNLYEIMEKALSFYQNQLKRSQNALNYLHCRKISDKTMQTFKLGFAPAIWDGLSKALQQYPKSALQAAGLIIQSSAEHYYDRFRNRIIFPIHDQRGRCIGFGGRALSEQDVPKYLNSPETLIFHKKSELYGFYEARNSDRKERIWIVEGYMDVLSIYQTDSQVVATLGTATNYTHLQKLFQVTEEIIFCFDGDHAGYAASLRALDISLSYFQEGWSIRFLLLPQGQDPDSWVNQSHNPSFDELLSETLSLSEFLFRQMQDKLDLSTPEGKSQLIRKTLPLLKKMPKSLMKTKLFEQLAYLVNTDPGHLTQILSKPQHRKIRATTQPKVSSIQDHTLSFLVQYPTLLKSSTHISPKLLQKIAKHYSLLHSVIHRILKSSPANTAILLEYFRQQPEQYQHLSLLARHNWLLSETQLEAEFQEICIRLEQCIDEKLIEILLQQSQKRTLTNKEKQQLMHFLSKKQ